MNLGEFIKYHRKERKISIRKLALYSGVSNAYISQIENGKSDKPSPNVLKKLAGYLNVSYDELLEKAGYIEVVKPSQELKDLLSNAVAGDAEANAKLDRIRASDDSKIDLGRILDSPNVVFNGTHLTEHDKQRIRDFLTGLLANRN